MIWFFRLMFGAGYYFCETQNFVKLNLYYSYKRNMLINNNIDRDSVQNFPYLFMVRCLTFRYISVALSSLYVNQNLLIFLSLAFFSPFFLFVSLCCLQSLRLFVFICFCVSYNYTNENVFQINFYQILNYIFCSTLLYVTYKVSISSGDLKCRAYVTKQVLSLIYSMKSL